MKKHLLLAALMVFTFSLAFAAGANDYTPQQMNSETVISAQTGERTILQGTEMSSSSLLRRNETVFYQQDFNDGWDGWTTVDGTLPDAMWHLTEWNAYGGLGYSWWMGDPDIGGYRNNQYVVVDTPEILVTAANSTLNFKLNYNMEGLPDEPYNGYDGWDGANVRISTDGGNTWSVISGLPAYNATAMWSFGGIHNEGPNIPGWGGSSNGWVDASFDLSTYVGDNVRIRFAFASDGAADTITNPDWFGVMVDEISLGDFDHDFDDGQTQGMVSSSVVPVGGDLWHIGTTVPAPPSPPDAAICQNDMGSYDGNMLNYLVSPPIELPASGDIRVDFMVRGELDGESINFPQVDYFGWEISIDNGTSWYAMSNPYNIPGGMNYVYLISSPGMWQSMTGAFSLDGFISDYAGETVMFRIYLRSIDHTPVGEGLMIDNYTIYHSEYLPVPGNLTAEVDEQTVELNWSAPGAGGSEGWIHWDDGINYSGVGLAADGGEYDVAAKFTREDMEPYVNGYITTVSFFPREVSPDYTIGIWSGISGDVEVYEQVVTNVAAMQWNEIELTVPVLIEFGEDYWIGYSVDQLPDLFPSGIDSGPRVPGKGDMIRIGTGSWMSLYNPNAPQPIDANWNIQALVEILDDRSGETKVVNLQRQDITGFNVYHSDESGENYDLIGTVDEDITTFLHDSPIEGGLNYYVVTALYGTSESGYSNEAQAFVIPETSHVFAYDDGVAESGHSVGNNNHLAMRFHPTIAGEAELTHIMLYIETRRTGAMIVKVWEDDNGLPAENALIQFIYPATATVEGWNYIPIPASTPYHLDGGAFFLGLQEVANSSLTGVDENNVGRGYTKIGTNPWTAFHNGNFMIRAIIDGHTDVEEILLPVNEKLTASNYPNPFNPETTIKMNIPQASHVRLTVYNIRGQLVKTLLNDHLNAGVYQYVWDGKDNSGNHASSGLYFYRLETEGEVLNKRMLLLK